LRQSEDRPEVPSPRLHLIYVAPADIQIPRVDRICIAKFCEAMKARGVDTTLVCAKIRVLETEPTFARAVWDVFGVRHAYGLAWVHLPLRQERLQTLTARLILAAGRTALFPVVAARHVLRDRRSEGVTALYFKNYGLVLGLLLARRLRPARTILVFEAHVLPRNRFQKWALGKADGIVCNGHSLHHDLLRAGLAQTASSIGIHQGFAEEAYPRDIDHASARIEARHRLSWGVRDKVVVYTGKAHWRYEEIDLLLQAFSQLKSDDIRLVVVGGRSDHVQQWQNEVASRNLGNVSFVGLVAPVEVPDYQVAADAVVSYYPSHISTREYLSPAKLFEYMASGTPIVAADHAASREVLRDGSNAILVRPDRPELLADAVRRLMNDQALRMRLGDQARKDVAQYTWTARAQRVSEFIAGLSHT
jgi:glycosyltransferase involved in cell wall biosynthesis